MPQEACSSWGAKGAYAQWRGGAVVHVVQNAGVGAVLTNEVLEKHHGHLGVAERRVGQVELASTEVNGGRGRAPRGRNNTSR